MLTIIKFQTGVARNYLNRFIQRFFAFLKNAIVVDGKIINVREYLKKTPKYQNFYTGTQAEREQKVKDFEKDVEDLLDTQSVLKLGELKEGEFSMH